MSVPDLETIPIRPLSVQKSAHHLDDVWGAPTMDKSRHYAELALPGGDHARTVGSDEAGFVLSLEDVGHPDHVMLRNACIGQQ